MELEYLKKIVDGKKAELIDLDREYEASMKQFKSRRASLQSQIEMFEKQIYGGSGKND
jgi:hypothetical protein